MTTYDLDNGLRPESADPAYSALVAFGLWLRAGSIGFAAAAIGLIMLASGETTGWRGIATSLAGAALAAVSWRRARMIVDSGDKTMAEPTSVMPRTPSKTELPVRATSGV